MSLKDSNDVEAKKFKNSKTTAITESMPNDWYDYSKSRWANIVVTDGTIKNGQITGATMTTYYTWIPR